MSPVHERTLVGSVTDCRGGDARLYVVHACKSPCHQHAVGYRGKLFGNHPNYLSLRSGSDLYLNIIDPPLPLFKDELFADYLRFAREAWDAGARLLVHCNQGESRAPSLALVFLAKHLGELPNESFAAARQAFAQRCSRYAPGRGIETYLTESWSRLDGF
jgi:hypothetical protein